MNRNCWICPVCRQELERREDGFTCQNRHHFDVARKGYVHLLPGKRAGQHGDNRDMLLARRDFLNGGAYAALADRIVACACNVLPTTPCVVDAGCGECYYTDRLARALAQRDHVESLVLGVDMSRQALALGHVRNPALCLAVASVYHMPIADASADLVLSVFAPYAGDEFLRIVRPGGKLCMVVPGPRHLFGLKELLYQDPYENRVADTALPGFRLLHREEISYPLTLDRTSVQALFRMTPYYYRTSPTDRDKLNGVDTLTTEISFFLLLYEKTDTRSTQQPT